MCCVGQAAAGAGAAVECETGTVGFAAALSYFQYTNITLTKGRTSDGRSWCDASVVAI